MRYTTIIDISSITPVWSNPHARDLYLYMALKSGYHDEDRDVVSISLRNLAWRLRMTISAVRFALHVLQREGLVKPLGGSSYLVLKWVEPSNISTRKSINNTKSIQEEADRTGKSPFMVQWERVYKVAYSSKGNQEQREWVERYSDRYRTERQTYEQNKL